MMKTFIQNEILSYGITPDDIKLALDLLPGSHYFMPLKDEGQEKFEIHLENEKSSIAFPCLLVEILLMIINKLSQGTAPILLPQYTELNLEEAMHLLNISKQEVNDLLEKRMIPFHERNGEKRILLTDILDYQIKEANQAIDKEARLIVFEPQNIIFTFNSNKKLITFINDSRDEFFIIKRKNLEPLRLIVPKKILNILVKILSKTTLAHRMMSFPIPLEISIKDASNILHSSENHIAQLLENNIIAYHQMDSLKYMKLEDVLAYKKNQDMKSLNAMLELTELWADEFKIDNGDTH